MARTPTTTPTTMVTIVTTPLSPLAPLSARLPAVAPRKQKRMVPGNINRFAHAYLNENNGAKVKDGKRC